MERLWTVENRIVAVLCLGGGVAALDAQALFYLSPFLVRDLGINNTQIGSLSAAVLVTWALSGFATSFLAGQLGGRKRWLIAAFAAFAVLSCLSGLSMSFGMLLLARLLIGVAEGPVIPLSQSIMIDESSPRRRGINMGIVQSFGSQLVGSAVSPLLLVLLATLFTWRYAFFIAGVPAIITALLIWMFVREPERTRSVQPVAGSFASGLARVRELLRQPNIRCCALASCFLNAWYFGMLTFLPLYLTQMRHLSPSAMSMVMASGGAGAVLSSVLVPWLSDRVGRRPVMMVFALVAIVGPLGIMLLSGGFAVLMAAAFVGSWAQGVVPLCVSVVPLESAPNRDPMAPGLMLLIGMPVGGVIGPFVFGRLADVYDLSVPLWGALVASLISAVIYSRLHETAPALVRAREDGARALAEVATVTKSRDSSYELER